MPIFGKVYSGATGPTDSMILCLLGESFGGGVRARLWVMPEYSERNFYIFINSIYIQTIYVEHGEADIVLPPGIGAIDSFWIEDAGLQGEPPEDLIPYISAHAIYADTLTANRLGIIWTAGGYSVTTPYNASELTIASISGAVRGINIGGVDGFRARGRLLITVTPVSGGNIIVRFWANNRLVAEGSRSGSGPITCAPFDNSGLTVECAISTGTPVAVVQGSAWVDVKWPSIYKVFHGTSPINFAGAHQFIVPDSGADKYDWQSGTLPAGTRYFGVMAVDDEGNPEISPAEPEDSPQTILAVPNKATITGVTLQSFAANVATYRISYDSDEATNNVYASLPNEPINFGNLTQGPEPVIGNATFGDIPITIPASAPDCTTEYATLTADFDTAVLACHTAFDAGETGFDAALETFEEEIDEAIEVFGASLGYSFRTIRQNVTTKVTDCLAIVAANSGLSLDADEWKSRVGPNYGELIRLIGDLLDNAPNRYPMPNGAIPGSLLAGNASGESAVGSMPSDTGGEESLRTIAEPFIKPLVIRAVVRAEDSGIEDQSDNVFEFEVDPTDGSIIQRPPNAVTITSLTVSNTSGTTFTITANVGVIDDNYEESDEIDLYAIPAADSFDFTVPDASEELTDEGQGGWREATCVATVTGNGWYKIAAKARTSTGRRSDDFPVRYINLSNDSSTSATNVRGRIVRGKGPAL